MVQFNAMILQFGEQGEKTGWRYIEVPADIAQQLKPGNKKSFRVKGMLDNYAISGCALLPMGEGKFIIPLKTEIRKSIHKEAGAMLAVKLEEHKDFKVEMPADLQDCFDFDPEALVQFNSLPMSHRNYFIKWITDAKTSETRAKRIINTVNAMLRKWSYNVMIREMKKE
ncbi:MAG: YdeI/OmpD-associated family protein [Mucilaginibacter sp.]